jgi:hypothetical protein
MSWQRHVRSDRFPPDLGRDERTSLSCPCRFLPPTPSLAMWVRCGASSPSALVPIGHPKSLPSALTSAFCSLPAANRPRPRLLTAVLGQEYSPGQSTSLEVLAEEFLWGRLETPLRTQLAPAPRCANPHPFPSICILPAQVGASAGLPTTPCEDAAIQEWAFDTGLIAG